MESVTVRIHEIGATEKSFFLNLERDPSFLELRHGPVEVLDLETDRHRLRRRGGLGLAVRMQRDDRPPSFQLEPFVPNIGPFDATQGYPGRTSRIVQRPLPSESPLRR